MYWCGLSVWALNYSILGKQKDRNYHGLKIRPTLPGHAWWCLLDHIITTNNYSLTQFLLIYFVIVMCVILLLLCVCSLISGPRRYPGIFVDYVRPGSISAEVGLKREDQILSINDIPFNNVTIQQVQWCILVFRSDWFCCGEGRIFQNSVLNWAFWCIRSKL